MSQQLLFYLKKSSELYKNIQNSSQTCMYDLAGSDSCIHKSDTCALLYYIVEGNIVTIVATITSYFQIIILM